jgi:hypothetical protein
VSITYPLRSDGVTSERQTASRPSGLGAAGFWLLTMLNGYQER